MFTITFSKGGAVPKQLQGNWTSLALARKKCDEYENYQKSRKALNSKRHADKKAKQGESSHANEVKNENKQVQKPIEESNHGRNEDEKASH